MSAYISLTVLPHYFPSLKTPKHSTETILKGHLIHTLTSHQMLILPFTNIQQNTLLATC